MVLTHTEFDSFQLREGQAIVLSHGNQRIPLDHPGHIPMAPTPKEHDTASRDELSRVVNECHTARNATFFVLGFQTYMTLATQAGNYSAHRMPQARRLSVEGVASTGNSHHPLVATSQRRIKSHKSRPYSSPGAVRAVGTYLREAW